MTPQYNIDDLRTDLMETMQKLREGKIDVATAKAVAEIGQVVVNSAKVECDYIKASEKNVESGFFPSHTTPKLKQIAGGRP